MSGTSKRMSWMEMTSGVIKAETPRMNRTLKMLLPTTLPMERSACPPLRLKTHGKFRRTGPKGHDGQSNHQRRHTRRGGDRHGPPHQQLPAADQQRQPAKVANTAATVPLSESISVRHPVRRKVTESNRASC